MQWTSTISTHDASLQFTELKLPWINQTCVVVHIWLIIQNIYLVRKISVVRLFNIHNNPNSPLQVFWQICMSSPCNDLIKVKIPGENLDVIVIAKETNTLHCKTQWPLCKARQGQGRGGKGKDAQFALENIWRMQPTWRSASIAWIKAGVCTKWVATSTSYLCPPRPIFRWRH